MSKKHNKFMVGAVTAAMVATAVAPAAGAEVNTKADTYSDVSVENSHFDNIYKAKDLGFLQGNPDGTFEPAKTLTRSNVVKALGKYVVAKEGKTMETYDVSGVTPFADVPASIVDKELYNYSLVVKKAGIFSGDSNKLNPLNDISRQQMAKVLVNAFGLKDLANKDSNVTDNNEAFAEFVPFINILSENGVTNVEEFMPKGDTSRAQFASFLVRSYEASTPEATTPAVASVSAINTTVVEVKFNTAVNELMATNPANYQFNGAALPTSAELELSADDRTVTITLSKAQALTNETTLNVTSSLNDSIEDTNETAIEETLTAVKINDTKLPTVTGSNYIFADDELTLTFSEPLTDLGTVVVTNADGVDQLITPTLDASGLFATLDTSALEEDEVFTLTMVGATDLSDNRFAGNTVSAGFRTGASELVKPTVSTVKALSSDTIEVTFSEKLSAPGTLNTVALVEGANYEVDESGLVYTITVPTMQDDSVVNYTFAGQEDLNENVIDTVTKQISYFDDVVAPKLVSRVAEGRLVTLTFDEVVVDAGGTASLRTPENVLLSVDADDINTVAGNNKQITVDLSAVVGSDAVNGNYTLTLANGTVTDTEGNSIAYASNFALADLPANDTDKPEVVSGVGYAVAANAGTVTVSFDEEVNSSALNLNNYKVDGQNVFEDAYFAGNKQTVVLTLKENSFSFDAERVLTVSNVSDLTGNMMNVYSEEITFEDNTAPSLLSAQLEDDLQTITLTFNEAMDETTIAELPTGEADFNVLVNGVAQTGTIVEAGTASDRVFTILLEDELTATEYARTITLTPTADFDVADDNGNVHATFSSVTVAK